MPYRVAAVLLLVLLLALAMSGGTAAASGAADRRRPPTEAPAATAATAAADAARADDSGDTTTTTTTDKNNNNNDDNAPAAAAPPAAALSAALRALIAALPKAELHLHLEGTLEVPMMMRLAARNNVTIPYANIAEARRARRSYASLAPFLEAYRTGARTLRTREDFKELAAAYLERAARDNVRRAEIFVDLQTHVAAGVRRRDVVGGVQDALEAAARPEHRPRPVDAALILCFVRDLGPLAAAAAAAAAAPYLGAFIGVGLASAEVGNPPAPFWPVFRAAEAAGKHRVCHAGEEGGPDYVWQALDALRVERVDHGVRALEDPRLVARLRERRVPLTICPLSNRALKVYDGQLRARMHEMFLESGLVATVNSDDPAYFAPAGGGSEEGGGDEDDQEEPDGYVNSNYSYLARLVGLGPRDLLRLAQASLNASFWDEEHKRRAIGEAEAAWRAWDEGPHGRAYRRAVAAEGRKREEGCGSKRIAAVAAS